MIVVFDTNIWMGNLFLRTGPASAVKYFIKQKSAKIGMPEVVRLEVEEKIRTDMKKKRREIKRNHHEMLSVFQNLKEVVLPTDQEIEALASSFLNKLGVPLVEVPFSFESAKSSFNKIMSKTAPSRGDSQQFKDGVIWADCLELAADDDVILVSGDLDFYESNNPDSGLASELKEECEQLSRSIRLVHSIKDLLDELGSNVSVPEGIIFNRVLYQDESGIRSLANRNGFKIGGLTKSSQKVFATEDPDQLFVEFSIIVECIDTSGGHRDDSSATVAGNGLFDVTAQNLSDVKFNECMLKITSQDGLETELRSVIDLSPRLGPVRIRIFQVLGFG